MKKFELTTKTKLPHHLSKQQGFTLLEVMVVVVIIAVMAAAVGPAILGNLEKANFERAARELKAYYIDQGRVTPELIMKKYTPSSDGSWARSVNQWMSEMRYDDRVLGQENKADSAYLLEFTSEGSGSGQIEPQL